MKSPFNIFAGITAPDFISVYDPISRLRSADFVLDFSWGLCSFTFESGDEKELHLTADQVKKSLLNHNTIVATGKFSSQKEQKGKELFQWLKICNIRQKNSIGVYRFIVSY